MADETTDGGPVEFSDADAQNLLADAVDGLLAEEGDSKTYDEGYVRKLRDENAKRRVKEQEAASQLEKLQAQLSEYENAKLTESERIQKELEELRTKSQAGITRAQEAELKYQIALAANDPSNQIGDVKAAIKLMDRDSLEFDDKGRITNLQDALETLKTEYPSLRAARQVSAPNTGTTNPSKQASAKRWTREDLRGMKPERIVELQSSGELNHLLGGN